MPIPSPQSKPHVQTRPVAIGKRPRFDFYGIVETSFCRTLNRCRLRPASSWIFGGPRDLKLFIRPSKLQQVIPSIAEQQRVGYGLFTSVFFTKLKPLVAVGYKPTQGVRSHADVLRESGCRGTARRRPRPCLIIPPLCTPISSPTASIFRRRTGAGGQSWVQYSTARAAVRPCESRKER